MSKTTTKASKTPTKAKAQKAAPENRDTDGLRSLQVQVLGVLFKAKGPLSRAKIYEKLGWKHQSGLTPVLGKNEDRTNEPYPSLLTLGLVRVVELDIDGHAERAYELTAKGKQKAQKVK